MRLPFTACLLCTIACLYSANCRLCTTRWLLLGTFHSECVLVIVWDAQRLFEILRVAFNCCECTLDVHLGRSYARSTQKVEPLSKSQGFVMYFSGMKVSGGGGLEYFAGG